MPNKTKPPKRQPKPLYRRPPPKLGRPPAGPKLPSEGRPPRAESHLGHPVSSTKFELREDGSIVGYASRPSPSSSESAPIEIRGQKLPDLIFTDASRGLWLYHGNCLELLDVIAAKYPDGRFDCIFADPPYFLSNGGITCHAGRMVKVDKGDWDKSRGPELNHEFNTEWLRRCQRVLKPNGTLWVSGTLHVIFSIGYALQQLGYKILNDIAWEKPNPPPNLSCRYFTHSTETILWAAKNEHSKHVFNYQAMRKVTGKQMKTVWQFYPPARDEKEHGKHPTQKPVALVERCLLASTNEGDLVLDPFLGGGTTAIAAIHLNRRCVGIEADVAFITLAARRCDHEIIEIWLRHFRVRVEISVVGRAELLLRQAEQQHGHTEEQNDLDLFPDSINGSRDMADVPEIQTDRIFHETKFVFLSCAEVQRGTVVHTTVDVSLQEAWAKTPTGKKRETTHVVRCETEIFRVTRE